MRPAAAGGIYVHFPYCAHRCAYCDFNVVTPRRIPQAAYTEALLVELGLRGQALGGAARTLYIGGGTPSLWAPGELARFVEAMREAPGLASGAEVTLEANPEDVTPERVAAWRRLGITRVSLGVEALRDPLLGALGRTHGAAQATAAARAIAEGGFASWSADLIFGAPGQTRAAWEADLAGIIDLGAPHLSIYGLTVEPRTVLARRVRDARVRVPGNDRQAQMLLATRRVLRAAGYTHYEISSYARQGHRAVHNTGYWHMRPYLGLGPGAHGFVTPVRSMNVRRPAQWIQRLTGSEAPMPPVAEEERLSSDLLLFERLMTGLRDLERGVAQDAALAPYHDAIERAIAAGDLRRRGQNILLTEHGLMFMDDVLIALMR